MGQRPRTAGVKRATGARRAVLGLAAVAVACCSGVLPAAPGPGVVAVSSHLGAAPRPGRGPWDQVRGLMSLAALAPEAPLFGAAFSIMDRAAGPGEKEEDHP
ncbi:MAG TPA: hypothetical protein PKO09_07835 [Anaerolineae bacterium]|nr:hypothetical protein [Anaerolineae bacterium]